MFDENFTFDSPRSPSLDSAITVTSTRNSSRAISPCSMASAFPQPRYSVTDLAASFADQRIRKESPICYDSCDAYANNDDDADWSIPSIEDEDIQQLARSQTFPQQRHSSPPRRAQRQANARLLCTASHRSDIAALVARMVDNHEQCCVATSRSTTPTPDEDEGYDSDDQSMDDVSRRSSSSIATSRTRVNFRRASEHTGACVSKRIRLRKDKNHRRIRSSEQTAS